MYKAKDLSALLVGAKTRGNIECELDGINLCNRSTVHNSILSYVTNDDYIETVISNTSVKVLLVNKASSIYDDVIISRGGCVITSSQPEKDFYAIHEALLKKGDFYDSYDYETQIGENCNIHPLAVIDRGVTIGNNVTIGALTVIKKGTIIEDNSTIGCNTVIGSEGFQLITDGEKEPLHITHAGGVHICQNVYVGDCTCIANSLFEGATYIGKGAKIDNLVYIAHNLYIGENAVITAHAILCGSSVIEKGAWIAPNCSVLNRVTIGEYSKVGLGSVVTRDIPPHSLAYGVPAKVKQK